MQNISQNAEQRYNFFVNEYPNLSNRLPNTQVASYLGITPEFLSKIRKNVIKTLPKINNEAKSANIIFISIDCWMLIGRGWFFTR